MQKRVLLITILAIGLGAICPTTARADYGLPSGGCVSETYDFLLWAVKTYGNEWHNTLNNGQGDWQCLKKCEQAQLNWQDDCAYYLNNDQTCPPKPQCQCPGSDTKLGGQLSKECMQGIYRRQRISGILTPASNVQDIVSISLNLGYDDPYELFGEDKWVDGIAFPVTDDAALKSHMQGKCLLKLYNANNSISKLTLRNLYGPVLCVYKGATCQGIVGNVYQVAPNQDPIWYADDVPAEDRRCDAFNVTEEISEDGVNLTQWQEEDDDEDGVKNGVDNCNGLPNPEQADQDNDGKGDPCEDSDGDGFLDGEELVNMYWDPNAGTFGTYRQIVFEHAPIHNAITDVICAQIAKTTNPNQVDTDGDGLSDYCEVDFFHTDPVNADSDCDGLADGAELGLTMGQLVKDCSPASKGQGFSDLELIYGDGTPESKPIWSNPHVADSDNDGVADNEDNCPGNTNGDQTDSDANGVGDLCQEKVCPDGTTVPFVGGECCPAGMTKLNLECIALPPRPGANPKRSSPSDDPTNPSNDDKNGGKGTPKTCAAGFTLSLDGLTCIAFTDDGPKSGTTTDNGSHTTDIHPIDSPDGTNDGTQVGPACAPNSQRADGSCTSINEPIDHTLPAKGAGRGGGCSLIVGADDA